MIQHCKRTKPPNIILEGGGKDNHKVVSPGDKTVSTGQM
jgi:hypothetical protein